MSFGSVYGIQKYHDDKETRVNKDYSRYQTIKAALLFGYKIDITSNGQIMLTNLLAKNKQNRTIVIDALYPNSVFKANFQTLTEEYNDLVDNYCSRNDIKYIPNKDVYAAQVGMAKNKLEEAYPYTKDPQDKAKDLLVSMKNAKKREAFVKNYEEQFKQAEHVLNSTTWGKSIAQALKYFWEHSGQEYQQGSQFGE